MICSYMKKKTWLWLFSPFFFVLQICRFLFFWMKISHILLDVIRFVFVIGCLFASTSKVIFLLIVGELFPSSWKEMGYKWDCCEEYIRILICSGYFYLFMFCSLLFILPFLPNVNDYTTNTLIDGVCPIPPGAPINAG